MILFYYYRYKSWLQKTSSDYKNQVKNAMPNMQNTTTWSKNIYKKWPKKYINTY